MFLNMRFQLQRSFCTCAGVVAAPGSDVLKGEHRAVERLGSAGRRVAPQHHHKAQPLFAGRDAAPITEECFRRQASACTAPLRQACCTTGLLTGALAAAWLLPPAPLL